MGASRGPIARASREGQIALRSILPSASCPQESRTSRESSRPAWGGYELCVSVSLPLSFKLAQAEHRRVKSKEQTIYDL